MALGGEGAAMGFIRGSKQNVGWGAVGGGEALPVGGGRRRKHSEISVLSAELGYEPKTVLETKPA